MTDEKRTQPPRLVIGTRCTVVRRLSHSSTSVVHRWEATIVKLTPRRAYLDYASWFALDDPRREVRPRYMDYTTVVVEVHP